MKQTLLLAIVVSLCGCHGFGRAENGAATHLAEPSASYTQNQLDALSVKCGLPAERLMLVDAPNQVTLNISDQDPFDRVSCLIEEAGRLGLKFGFVGREAQ